MKFYISPDTKQKVESKLNNMFRRFENRPEVSFSEVTKKVQTTFINHGWGDYSRFVNRIDAIEVTIEDVKAAEWVLVATVDYNIGKLLICDSRYFKDIPAHYGLNYFKCDHCGSEHKNRNEAHILYNTISGDWMQVGSTCVNKLVNGGKYLNGFMLKLYEVFSSFGGCDEWGWGGGWWRPADNYCRAAIEFNEALMVCKHYMETVSDVWKRTEYTGGTKTYGTNHELMGMVYEMHEKDTVPGIDQSFINSIRWHFDKIEYGEEGYEKTLTQKIKDAIKDEWISVSEMYIAWFAIANYYSSLTKAGFEKQVESLGIQKGSEYKFCGDLEKVDTYETIDWRGYESIGFTAVLKDDATGLVFTKDIANAGVIEKFRGTDGKYRFTATVKFIAWKRQQVGFGGRLKKTK